MSTRVGVIGSLGRVGSSICAAVQAAPDLELVATVDKDDSLESLVAAGCEVVVDFTHPDVVMRDVEFLVRHGIHAVVGTTGWSDDRLAQVRTWLEASPSTGNPVHGAMEDPGAAHDPARRKSGCALGVGGRGRGHGWVPPGSCGTLPPPLRCKGRSRSTVVHTP